MEVKTEHPYVVRESGICGGRPTIKGTRIAVELVARLYGQGCSSEDIVAAYPQMRRAAIYDAISYYLDHEDEIEVKESLEDLKQRYNFELGPKGLIKFRTEPCS